MTRYVRVDPQTLLQLLQKAAKHTASPLPANSELIMAQWYTGAPPHVRLYIRSTEFETDADGVPEIEHKLQLTPTDATPEPAAESSGRARAPRTKADATRGRVPIVDLGSRKEDRT